MENVSTAPSVPGSEGEVEAATKTDLRERVAERVLKHYPNEPDVDKLVDKVQRGLSGALLQETGNTGELGVMSCVMSAGPECLQQQRSDLHLLQRAGGLGRFRHSAPEGHRPR